MKNYGLYLMLFALTFPVQAQVYKWTDSKGDVHFSDKPHPGAQQIELPPVQSFSSPPVESTTPSVPDETQATKESIDYQLTIVEPMPEATIRNNQGYVSVMVEVEPSLKEGDKLQILFDGAPLGEPLATTVFALRDINRGSHTIAVQLVDSKGKILKTTESITIYMHRPRTGMVPNTPPPRGAP